MLVVDEGEKHRCFVLKDEQDLFRVSYILLHERRSAGTYPSLDEARANYRGIMWVLNESEQRLANENKKLNMSPERLRRRKDAIDSLKFRIEDRYLDEIDFCERLEELLEKPMNEAIRLEWIFDNGGRTNLAWMLLSMRRDFPGEGLEFRKW